jgi:exodeoxyribonuclease VII small subunit
MAEEKKAEKKKPAYEESVRKLEEITSKIESGQVDLDKTIQLFEEGVGLAKDCHEVLNKAELRVKKLMGEHGKDAEDFEPE